MIRSYILASFFLALSTHVYSLQNQESIAEPWLQWGDQNPSWVAPFDPFRIIGEIYFVGTEGLSSFLITTPDGHILIDGGMPQNVEQIIGSIEKLGFDIADVKVLLNSHAHFDHSGGLRALKQASGAKLIASEGDRSALEGGFYLGAEDNINYRAPPVNVDEIIENGGQVKLGGISLTAHITPGHTRGCTSYKTMAVENGIPYEVLFFCGATVAGNRLVPEQYSGIVDDYRKTFALTTNWRPDVLLVNHPFFFDMKNKRTKQVAGDPFAFVDQNEFPRFISHWRTDFEKQLRAAQSSKGK